MLIGILSDTHNKLERTQRAVEMLRKAGAQVLFHCGDVTTAEIIGACTVLPCHFTLGNNDSDNVRELEQAAAEYGAHCLHWGSTVEVAGKKIGVVHGHMTTDVRRVLDEQPDYLFSGHSHIPADFRTGKVRRINPGALHRAPEFTVATLDLLSDALQLFVVPR